MTALVPSPLSRPLALPCGVVLKNRIAKSAMSDSLGDGCGHPTEAQIRLYERWAEGGAALSIIGEVQGTPNFAEKPGNLVLHPAAQMSGFEKLATAGASNNANLWLQLGHAGAMADAPISTPKGPSALDIPGLACAELTMPEIQNLPAEFAQTAALAQGLGFGGVEIHAAHGFLLNQFLSPLFNKRNDAYGGSLTNRMRVLIDVITAVRAAVGPSFPIGLKLNATDQLVGGFEQDEALQVITALDGIDLIDISGGTYFPGAPSSSDRVGSGPYFLDFAARARGKTDIPLMVTGGFKTFDQAARAVDDGAADMIGLARALVIDPDVPNKWVSGDETNPDFPRFSAPPEGGVTAWYTMQITHIANGAPPLVASDLEHAMSDYQARDHKRCTLWNNHFGLSK
ncbi:NADH:flavin oxidoreductase/NADH oxidase family protein [Shimia abyssi]|uniref:2,4-dienoyl-CoA reductase-like NADH-dependent reductase (Old Yellow Enzyme family) n=1 Tax=Shimia abyssi TaxID=1662395 RepID=A0A2P8F6B7_9RHOB|nr:NADH:flavin oxidoreductase/NADH oxidase family protein [Shimia abyssi]PSL17264.1 2,4-dienoyl-CoA reductase-like NADH-dependent reductase (Old Yellow Enzyme family) [Shimia abyssi]